MWIFLPFGFFSIVATEDPHKLLVRARVRSDLEAFAERVQRVSGTLPMVHKTAHRDYLYRFEAPRVVVERVLGVFVLMDLTYDNFKAEVAKTDRKRERFYHKVWDLLRRGLQGAR